MKISKDAEKPWFSVNFLHTLHLDADMLRVLRLIAGIRFERGEGQRAKSLSPFSSRRNKYIPFWSSAPHTKKEKERCQYVMV